MLQIVTVTDDEWMETLERTKVLLRSRRLLFFGTEEEFEENQMERARGGLRGNPPITDETDPDKTPPRQTVSNRSEV